MKICLRQRSSYRKYEARCGWSGVYPQATGRRIPVFGPDSPLEVDDGTIPVDVDLHEDRDLALLV
jgi:hypothetical protein